MTVQAEQQDRRVDMLNTLLTTPHRDLEKVYPVHKSMIDEDPLFYVRLAAWYVATGDIRDHKEMFIVNLCLSDFDGHREVGLAMLRDLPPYQVARVVDFINGRTIKKHHKAQAARPATRRRRAVAAQPARTEEVKFGLYKTIPRSLKTEVTRYLREREDDAQWFDSSVLVARKYLRHLYKLFRLPPSDRAQAILFDDTPPEDSSLYAAKQLTKAKNPVDQARAIIENRIPYRVASTVISNMTPTVILALIEVMSDQELINNVGSLRRRGAFDNPDLKGVITKRLEKAKKSKKVSALKAIEAAKASGASDDVKELLEDVADKQVKAKGRIMRSTALLVDKSASMNVAIEIGKQMGAMISSAMGDDIPFYCYTFDVMPYKVESKGTDIASWNSAFKGIRASGGTGCGCSLAMMERLGEKVEQIMMITDEGENNSPYFLTAYQSYCEKLGVKPNVFILRVGEERHIHTVIYDKLVRAGVDVDVYQPDKADYYALPDMLQYLTRPSRLDLLLDIMAYPLPERKQVQQVA